MNKWRKSTVLICSGVMGMICLGTGEKALSSSNNKYHCINHNGTPTTVVDTDRGRISLITWQSNYFSASGYTPQRRCQEVTGRFQTHSDKGNIRYITTGNLNGHTIICVAQKRGDTYSCQRDGLLITLELEDNATGCLMD